MAGICTRDAGAVVTQSKAIDRVSARSGCSGDFRGTVNYDRSGVSQRLAHHRLPPAGAAELHLDPRGATGKESLAAVDTTVLSLRRACPGTLIGVSTGAWIESDEVHTRDCIAQWNELPDYASVNLSERDAPAIIELLRRRGIAVEAGLASVADAERLVKLPVTRPVLRILIEIAEQDLGVTRQVASNIAAVLNRAGLRRPILLHGVDATEYGPLLSLRVSDVGRPGPGWRTASISRTEQ